MGGTEKVSPLSPASSSVVEGRTASLVHFGASAPVQATQLRVHQRCRHGQSPRTAFVERPCRKRYPINAVKHSSQISTRIPTRSRVQNEPGLERRIAPSSIGGSLYPQLACCSSAGETPLAKASPRPCEWLFYVLEFLLWLQSQCLTHQ